ncbi:MAG TPA: L,D-transpeptidase [Xanthobacteraceae bacterium]|nr:L,D-transpeptidase [Xanthobacteraceae bacterium]
MAQPRTQLAASTPLSPNLGGGFIEFMVTGNPAPRAARPAWQPGAPIVLPPGMRLDTAGVPRQRPNDVPPLAAGALPADGSTGVSAAHLDPQTVDYPANDPPGTIIVDTGARFLYLVQDGGKALRYGVGVGRAGFEWTGVKRISRKREWPDWRPPREMLARRPDLPRHMPGGPDNPLGARALYLGSTLYRIHGSNEPHTIGMAVSSGCIRMRNEDVIDLYERVGVGTKVRVL